MIRKINIKGFRGFDGNSQDIEFSLPNGDFGSGLTMIVGENNSGKSSILECIKLFSNNNNYNLSISESKRNKHNDDKVEIVVQDDNGITSTIHTINSGGSELIKDYANRLNILFIPSRRAFQKNFAKANWNIETMSQSGQYYNNTERIITYDEFTYLFDELIKNKNDFDKIINELVYFPEWTIDLNESNQYYLKIRKGDQYHNSEGLGEGMISILTMIGTLYLSKPQSTILIDEPELSIHPEVSKKIMKMLLQYSKDRQIIISTHSPYFIDLQSLTKGSTLIRVINDNNATKTYSLSIDSIDYFRSQLLNYHFPHATGTETKEIFFKSDKIIIVEGQEDVIGYNCALEQLSEPEYSFYGWGAGGSGNIIKVIKILRDLGFRKIAAIYDGDKREDYEKSKGTFPDVHFSIIPTDDIRDKDICGVIRIGLMTKSFQLKDEYKSDLITIFNEIKNYFNN